MVRQAADRDKARSDFNRLREQLRDPLLTVLTIVLAFWMFVLAPLHHNASARHQHRRLPTRLGGCGSASRAFRQGGARIADALGVSAAAAAWFRLHDPSPFDIVTLLRLYSPLKSSFTKEWRPSEIELVDGK